jgi:hypothetical protein
LDAFTTTGAAASARVRSRRRQRVKLLRHSPSARQKSSTVILAPSKRCSTSRHAGSSSRRRLTTCLPASILVAPHALSMRALFRWQGRGEGRRGATAYRPGAITVAECHDAHVHA